MTRILISEKAFERLRGRLSSFAGLECLVMDKQGTIRLDGAALDEAEAAPDCALISHDTMFAAITRSFLAAMVRSPALRWAHSAGTGVDHPMFGKVAARGVRLTISHTQAIGMAEYVLWGVLDHFQQGRALAAAQAGREWARRRAREIAGTRWLILGFGAIGEAVAHRARAFDAHVTGVRRNPRPSEVADAVVTPDRLLDHLPQSDVVLLCLPHSADTARLVDAEFLASMKPGSLLVNVGRGSALDEEALLAALDAGTPEHALLDVFRVEPLPADSPLWSHPRVTVTPHTSALSSGLEARADDLFLDNLARYCAGRPLLNEVAASDVIAASG